MLELYDSQELVPEELRATAIETKDGKWAAAKVPDVATLEATLVKERTARKDAERRAREVEERDRQREADKTAIANGATEAQLKEIREREEAARQPILTENEQLKAENRRLKLTDRVRALAIQHGVMADRIDDAMLLLDARVDLGDEGGLVFKDAQGNPTPQTPEQFFAAHKQEKKWLYAGTGSSGSGGEHSTGTHNGAPRVNPEVQQRKAAQVRTAF